MGDHVTDFMAFDPNDGPVIGIIAGEVSGDNLGAGLMSELKKLLPNAKFVGIGGPRMLDQGLKGLYSIEELSVMGLEVISKLFRILSIRHRIVDELKNHGISLFIGIDAPDFNLTVEERLKASGIPTVHYVCPSVWAWRKKRIFKIKRATNMVLSLLPFEKEFCDRYDTPCTFVGHPMADQIPESSVEEINKARNSLSIPKDGTYIGVLPGSRHGEIVTLTPVFLEACRIIQKKYQDAVFLVPVVNERRKEDFMPLLHKFGSGLNIRVYDGSAREVMFASDVVVLASGTATLECMLVGRPMVVGYRVSKITEMIARCLLTVDCVSLPNLLMKNHCVRELLQNDCTASNIAAEVERLLDGDNTGLLSDFAAQKQLLKQNASKVAAQACLDVLTNS